MTEFFKQAVESCVIKNGQDGDEKWAGTAAGFS